VRRGARDDFEGLRAVEPAHAHAALHDRTHLVFQAFEVGHKILAQTQNHLTRRLVESVARRVEFARVEFFP